MPPLPLERRQERYKQLSRVEYVKMICDLSLFPQMNYRRIAAHVGLSYATVAGIAAEGRNKHNFKTRGNKDQEYVNAPPPPTKAELRWRFENQFPVEIIADLGDDTWPWIVAAGLAKEAPLELRQLVAAPSDDEVPVLPDEDSEPAAQLIEAVGVGRVRIIGTDVELEARNGSEHAVINRVLTSLVARYEIPQGAWQSLVPVVNWHMEMVRLWDNATLVERKSLDFLNDYGQLLKAQNDVLAKLDLPKRKATEGWDAIERSLAQVEPYLQERGWREAMACPVCGHIQRIYYVLCRSLWRFLAAAEEALREAGAEDPESRPLIRQLSRLLRLADEDPYFALQLRELGVAFSLPLAEWFNSLIRPSVGQLRRSGRGFQTAQRVNPAVGQPLEIVDIEDETVRLRWLDDGELDTAELSQVTELTEPPITEEQIHEGLAAVLETSPELFRSDVPWNPLLRSGRDKRGRPMVKDIID